MDCYNDILVTITKRPDSEYYGFTTYDRKHGRKGEFLIHQTTFGMTHHIDTDCGNFAETWTHDDDENRNYTIKFTWLNSNYSYEVSGFTQLIKFTYDDLLAAPHNDGKPHRFISNTTVNTSRVTLSDSAHEVVANAITSKTMKRALSKAFRDNFHYNDNTTTTLYNDPYIKGFFFRNSWGTSGVLCPSIDTIAGTNGKNYTRIRYSKHT